ncbi:hypothetical protein LSH36_142g03004 [Paralvinella palmiformis]|uniref:Protein kinase domain-containing protein n=1 Tax=Paralvinella palmiformis TaxID=53620 RepID=A0AAD9JW90_9ANNE|nr:hypothetical protein LSH36_142g03004 [Paralvinella palmiformis]
MNSTTTEPEEKPLLDFDDSKVLFSFIGGGFALLVIIILALWCAFCPGNRRRRRRPVPMPKQPVLVPVVINEGGMATVLTIDRRQQQPSRVPNNSNTKGRRKVNRRKVQISALENKPMVNVNKYVEFEVPPPATCQKVDPIGVDPKLEEMATYITRKVTKVLQSINIEPERIQKQLQIGSGRFGVVYKGILTGADKTQTRQVALKTLAGDMQNDQGLEEFMDEIMKMANFKHPNVMQLLGLTTMDDKLHIVLPFMENGDLKTYISSNKKKFNVSDLLGMAFQVTKGMDYLGKQNLIHGDLAARNCMVGKNIRVKVADFGLSRQLYQSEYYTSQEPSSCPRPIRWMAIECIVENRYSVKSDVWSFGILLWELMTRGDRPYYDTNSNADVISMVRNGYRLSCPKYCADEIYELMRKCWDEDPNNRPNFTDIGKMIQLTVDTTDDYLRPKEEMEP